MEDKYQQIIQEIENKINTNGNKEITGAILQGVLLGIIAAVQANQLGKMEYYSEDKEDGRVDLSGQLLDLVRIVAGSGLTINTSGFKFRLHHNGLEIVDNSNTSSMNFDAYGLNTNLNISSEGIIEASGGLVLRDGYDNRYIVTVNQNGELIVESCDE